MIKRSNVSYLVMCICVVKEVKATKKKCTSAVMNIQKTTNSHAFTSFTLTEFLYVVHPHHTHTHPLYPDIANYCAHLQYREKKNDERKYPKRYDTIQITFWLIVNDETNENCQCENSGPVFFLYRNWLNHPKQVSLSSMVTEGIKSPQRRNKQKKEEKMFHPVVEI